MSIYTTLVDMKSLAAGERKAVVRNIDGEWVAVFPDGCMLWSCDWESLMAHTEQWVRSTAHGV